MSWHPKLSGIGQVIRFTRSHGTAIADALAGHFLPILARADQLMAAGAAVCSPVTIRQ